MLIEEGPLKYWIDHFYGYGSWRAPIWFVSYEEGGGELPEEVAEKVNYFLKTHSQTAKENLSDIRELYRHVAMRLEGPRAGSFVNRYDYRFGSDALQDSVWKNLIAFVHGYNHKKLPDVLEYQKHTFASASAQQEALIPFYPLPSPHNHAWYYSWIDLPGLGFIRSRNGYQEHLYKTRIDKILTNISIYKPKVVLMYGMDNINSLKKSVQDVFEGTKFTMVKATKLQIPQHHRADFDGTTLIITTQIPALRHNRIETGFDWAEFGSRIAD